VRTAVVLVRNPVSHDGRVLREAHVLQDLGFEVLVVGMVSKEERQTELELYGVRVVRLLGPRHLVSALLRRGEGAGGGTPARAEPGGDTPATRRRGDRLRRLLIAAAYNLQASALLVRTSPALVHANDYTTMWPGVAAKLLRRSRLVYDSHELWPDQGTPEWRPWLLAAEWLFVRVADALVAANPAISETMARRFRVDPPVVVRNVPEHRAASPAPPEGLRAGRAPLAVYVGGIVPGRGIEQAIDAVASVPQLRLRLMGQSSDGYRAELESRAAEAGLSDRIEFRPPVEPTAVADTIAGADMGILLTQPTCLNNVRSLPNKLFEYTTAGIPIVGSDFPVIGAMLREEGIGEPVPPTDVEAIAQAMTRLADRARNAEVRERVRDFAERTTWAHERVLLERVYASVLPAGESAWRDS
jgi:glycosyltransferase involved in cell wall biosynthesis